MRGLITGTLFALALVLAACGGGGGSRIVPSTGGGSTPNQPTTAKTTRASISLYIPPANKQNARSKPFYISSNTQAFAVYVEPYPSVAPTGLPSPMPSGIQIFPVATPSPCAAASGGGYICTLAVTAPVGTDLFVVAALNQASLGPNTIPLSAFISGPVAVSLSPSPGASPLSFTLNGVVNTAAVAVPIPDPRNTPNTQVFTALVPTSAPLAITAYDANGNVVMSPATQPFFAPLVINASPSADGVTLSLATSSHCGSTASGAQASIACAADLNNVLASYDGSTHPDTTDHVIDTFSIAASAQPNPSPSPANIVLASNVVAYPINVGGNYTSGAFLVPIAGGQLLYAFNLEGIPEIGTFTTANNAVSTPITLNGVSSIQAIAAAPNGTLWVEDYNGNNDVIDCWSSAASAAGGGAPVTVGIVPLSPNENPMYFQALSVDNANNVWTAGADSVTQQDYAGYFSAAGGCPAVAPTPVAQFTLNGDTSDESNWAAPLANGMAYVGYSPVQLFNITTTGPSSVNPIVPALAAANTAGGVATDGASNVYAAFRSGINENADAEWAASGASSLSSLFSLLPTSSVEEYSAVPYGLAVFSPTGTTADRLAYVDTNFDALGAADNLHTTPATLLAALPSVDGVFQVAYGGHGALYVLYQGYTTGYTLNIARAVNTTTWSQPLTSVGSNGGCSEGELVSIDERGNSGPFTLVASPAPNVTITALPGSNHDFFFTSNVGSPASMSLTITDVNGRTQTIPSFTVDEGGDC
ncbi:MAG: hypothetical protein WBD74_11800 [Candidatus Aquilonibacter sp.]